MQAATERDRMRLLCARLFKGSSQCAVSVSFRVHEEAAGGLINVTCVVVVSIV
jgi:hypothetical protein